MSEDIREIRLQKLQRMRELGHDPFAVEEFKRTGSAKHLLDNFDALTANEEKNQEATTITYAGRVVSYRDMGKAGFAHLSDGDGKIQIYCRKDELGDVAWELYQLLDIGDHVGVEGYLFLTKTGERSIHVQKLVPLSKSLQTLPMGKVVEIKDEAGNVIETKQFYGLEDIEQRYRHRHIDLVTNHEARKALIDRAKIVTAVRHYFDGAGYLEVETPMLQVVAGGAAARPFKTHYNAYDMEVKLRISLELYLKRLICGDIPAVYEIGRVFRNEGLSNRHSPEFSLLEFYEAYTNLEGMMRRVEEMFEFVAREVYGTTRFMFIGSRSKQKGGYLRPKSVIDYDFLENHNVSTYAPFKVAKLHGPEGVDLPSPESDPIQFASKLLESEGAYVVALSNKVFVNERTSRSVTLASRDTIDLAFSDGHQIKLEPGVYCVYRNPTGSEIMALVNQFNPMDATHVDFSRPWKRVDMLDSICEHSGLDRAHLGDLDIAKTAIQAKGVLDKAHALGAHIDLAKETSLGGLIEKLLEVFVEPTLQEPTFVVGYPIETSPLAKKEPGNPKMTRRFEGYILGREICNAFSEINDPIDQKERFEQQAREFAKGDDEAHPYDEDFVYALEGGMPPTGGCGIGMERLAMVLTGSEHIREIMFFPMMKPNEEAE